MRGARVNADRTTSPCSQGNHPRVARRLPAGIHPPRLGDGRDYSTAGLTGSLPWVRTQMVTPPAAEAAKYRPRISMPATPRSAGGTELRGRLNCPSVLQERGQLLVIVALNRL